MSNKDRIRVMMFEDNKHLRDSVQFLINSSADLECVAAFSDTRNILLHIDTYKPDVIVMDIEMPGMNGIETTRLVKMNEPSIQVLMFTVFDDKDKIFKALCAGGSGYILKNSTPAQILQAVRDVYVGGTALAPSVAKRVVNFFIDNHLEAPTDFGLTPKEKELLQNLVEGKSYKMIADAMSVSIETVKSHIKSVYRKLHVNSNHEAVAKAIRQRLI